MVIMITHIFWIQVRAFNLARFFAVLSFVSPSEDREREGGGVSREAVYLGKGLEEDWLARSEKCITSSPLPLTAGRSGLQGVLPSKFKVFTDVC